MKYKKNPDFIINNLTNFNNKIDNQNSQNCQNSKDNSRNNDNLSELKNELLKKEILENIINRPSSDNEINNQLNNISNITNLNPQDNNFDNLFIIHDNYKCQLKEYNKKNFDPFCRDIRIKLYYDSNNYFETTVAQLNFFKWSIDNYIIDYIPDNYQTIESSMLNYEKITKFNKMQKMMKNKKQKRKE